MTSSGPQYVYLHRSTPDSRENITKSTEPSAKASTLGLQQKLMLFDISLIMLPNLLEATTEYWHKLNELEAAYQRGEVSIEEVDAKVQSLMAELGRERRATLSYVVNGFCHLWNEQRETIVGIAILGIISYAWAVVS